MYDVPEVFECDESARYLVIRLDDLHRILGRKDGRVGLELRERTKRVNKGE